MCKTKTLIFCFLYVCIATILLLGGQWEEMMKPLGWVYNSCKEKEKPVKNQTSECKSQKEIEKALMNALQMWRHCKVKLRPKKRKRRQENMISFH